MDKICVRELFGIIQNIYLNRETGLLAFDFESGKRLIIFINGNIRYARSGIEGEQLGAFLVQGRYFSDKELDQHLKAAKNADARLGQYLCDKGIVEDADIQKTVRKLVEYIVVRPFFEQVREVNFEKKGVSLDPALMLNISTGNILLEAIRNLDETGFVEDLFEEFKDSIPTFMDNPMLLFQKVNLTPAEGFIFSRIDGSLTVGDIEKIASMPKADFVRTLFGLHLIGLIDFSQSQDVSFDEEAKQNVMSNLMDQSQPEPADAKADTGPNLTDEEKAFVEEVNRVHGDLELVTHYQLLDVSLQTSVAIIKKSYYKLMKRYHPDRFAHPRYGDVTQKLDEIVARLTAAYQVLKDKDSRNAYDKKLEEKKEEQPRASGGRQTSRKEVHYRDALFFISQSRYSEAIEMLERCIQLDPHDARFYLELGKLQVNNPMWAKKAESNLTNAIQFDPTKVEPYIMLAKMCVKNDRLESAEQYLNSALNLDPQNVEARETMIMLHKKSRKGSLFSRISGIFSGDGDTKH